MCDISFQETWSCDCSVGDHIAYSISVDDNGLNNDVEGDGVIKYFSKMKIKGLAKISWILL